MDSLTFENKTKRFLLQNTDQVASAGFPLLRLKKIFAALEHHFLDFSCFSREKGRLVQVLNLPNAGTGYLVCKMVLMLRTVSSDGKNQNVSSENLSRNSPDFISY